MTSPNAQSRATSTGFTPFSGRPNENPGFLINPGTTEPGGGGRVVGRAFRRAAAAVYEHAGRVVPQDIGTATPETTLGELVGAIQRAVRGEPVDIPVSATPRAAAGLLTSLRSAFLSELSRVRESVRPADIVQFLEAIDAVNCTVTGRAGSESLDGSSDRALHLEIAHDMRSPLTSVLFLVETIRSKRSGPVTPVQERQLGLIYSAAFALSALANDLIELAPGSERLLDKEDVPFSVADVFCGVRDLLLPIAEERRLDLRFSPPESDWRMGRPAAIQRVLVNLTTNALKFTTAGSVTVTAKQLSRRTVEFSVTDTGSGIPAHVMASLDDDRSVDAPGRPKFTSAGLGLALCRKLVRSMRGELRAECTPGSGTRMSFTLDLPPASRF